MIVSFISVSGPPENVTVFCNYDNVTRSSYVLVSWNPPSQPNGKIVYYNVSFLTLRYVMMFFAHIISANVL